MRFSDKVPKTARNDFRELAIDLGMRGVVSILESFQKCVQLFFAIRGLMIFSKSQKNTQSSMVPAAVELESPFMVQNLLVLTMLRCQLSFNAGDISLVGWPARCVWQGSGRQECSDNDCQ